MNNIDRFLKTFLNVSLQVRYLPSFNVAGEPVESWEASIAPPDHYKPIQVGEPAPNPSEAIASLDAVLAKNFDEQNGSAAACHDPAKADLELYRLTDSTLITALSGVFGHEVQVKVALQLLRDRG